MKIATVLFTYKRSYHTKLVLDSLRNNTVLPEKLFIFQDGIKCCEDYEEWNKVNNLIKSIDFCDTQVIVSEKNRGLAESVSQGVSEILKEYDAVIVLEDDCVAAPNFISYMVAALNKYKKNENVYCINAADEPIDVPDNGCDAYFMGRINSWGWATWKERWSIFSNDYNVMNEIKRDSSLYKWLRVWGQDLELMLRGNMMGEMNSWAVFWALQVIKRKGLCLAPYKSYINNIGFDQTATHCSSTDIPAFKMDDGANEEFVFPETYSVIKNYEKVFANYYPWTDPLIKESYYKELLLKWNSFMIRNFEVDLWFKIKRISHIAIWGMGSIGENLIEYLSDIIKIDYIIEMNPTTDKYGEIRCISYKDIPKDMECILIVPGYDIDRIRMLVDEKISRKMYLIDELFSNPLPHKDDISGMEFLGSEYGGFNVCIPAIKDDGCVFSFGVGEDLSFSDALLKKCNVKIYAFDPTPRSMRYVKNHHLFDNDNFLYFNVGLSDCDKKTKFYLPKNQEYVSGSECVSDELDTNNYIDVNMKSLRTIAHELNIEKINLLKMDIEGSEFCVFDNWDEKYPQVDQICLETHGRFFEDGYKKLYALYEKLLNLGFRLVAVSSTKEELTFLHYDCGGV